MKYLPCIALFSCSALAMYNDPYYLPGNSENNPLVNIPIQIALKNKQLRYFTSTQGAAPGEKHLYVFYYKNINTDAEVIFDYNDITKQLKQRKAIVDKKNSAE